MFSRIRNSIRSFFVTKKPVELDNPTKETIEVVPPPSLKKASVANLEGSSSGRSSSGHESIKAAEKSIEQMHLDGLDGYA
jgi:hypothetical protein